MRQSIVNGNGAVCDICSTSMKPFEIYRITGSTLVPGNKYPDVSSDTKYKTVDKFHLCEDCYEKVVYAIHKKLKKDFSPEEAK